MAPRTKKVTNKYTKTQKPKRKMFTYSQDALRMALIEIQENQMGIREASRKFAVPKTTLQDRLNGRVPEVPMKTGPPPRLTVTGENEIVQWIINIAKCGFPVRKTDLISTVQKILKDCGKETLFKDGKPGQKWYQNFLKRHPEISVREAETINKARAFITEEAIRLWFKKLRMYLTQNNCADILDNPSRILNGDESGFSLCPKTGKVLGPRGYKNLYKIKAGSDKDNVTVLIVFAADGKICPPLVIFPYVRPPRAVVENMPPNWVLGKSESGWMRSDVFFEYIANDFNQWVEENKLKRPILLLVDGHKSHMSLPLSKFCHENEIILYALPPNTTHMLQPADVSVFRPLKLQWQTTVSKWQSKPENLNQSITKVNFCPIFNEALQSSDMTNAIKNGFRRCGLFPFDPNNVDYTKCVKNTLEQQHALNSKRIEENEVTFTHRDFRVAEQIIKKIGSNLETYGINPEVIVNEINFFENEEMRQFVLKESNISPKTLTTEEPTTNSEETIIHMAEGVGIIEYQEQLSSDSIMEITVDSTETVVQVTEDTTTKENESQESPLSDLTESNLSSKTVTTDKPAVMEDVPNFSPKNTEVDETILVTNDVVQTIEETASYSNVESSVESNERQPLLSLQGAFKQHLVFPAAQDKKKEVKERLPSAISAGAWREYYTNKENEAKRKLNEKQKRKEERELRKDNEQEKTRKVRKNVAKKQVPLKKKKIYCSLCDDELVSDAEEEAERNIGCDFCPRWFHLHCTELNELPYAVAAERDFKCNMC